MGPKQIINGKMAAERRLYHRVLVVSTISQVIGPRQVFYALRGLRLARASQPSLTRYPYGAYTR